MYSFTITANSYVPPYNYYGGYAISSSDIEEYGYPISVTACTGNNGATPIHMNKNANNVSLTAVSKDDANIKAKVVFLKIS